LKIKSHWRSVLTRYPELKLAVISSVGQFFEVLDSQYKIGKSCFDMNLTKLNESESMGLPLLAVLSQFWLNQECVHVRYYIKK